MTTNIEFAQEGNTVPFESPETFLGKRIEYQGSFGTVKYSGPLKHQTDKPDANQVWLGIQWDTAERGRHNGTVENVKYFECDDGLTSGTLLKLDKANFGINIYDGIHLRYFNTPVGTASPANADQTQHQASINAKGESVEYDEEAYFETVKKFKKKVEFIGFDKIWKKINDLKNIRDLSLPHLNISDIGVDGSLGALLPSLRTLSLEGNLLYDWNQIFLIGRELKNLEELSISGNRLQEPEEEVKALNTIRVNSNDTTINEAPLNVFANLKNIALLSMNLTWKTLDKLLPMFKNVESLVLCFNKLTDFENLTLSGSDFKNLQFLNLEGNNIQTFEGIKKFHDAPKLSKLILNKNQINRLHGVTGFESVATVIIEENGIEDFTIFSHLNQFPRLETLRFTKNPISQKHNPLHIRQRAIAEIKNLKNINGGELKKYERKDCELYYLRNTFQEYFDKSGETSYSYDFDEFKKFCAVDHPRIPELMKMYGNPYDDGIKGQAKPEAPIAPAKAALTPVKLNAFTGPHLGKPAVTKKFTENTLITNLKAMLAKQFGIPANKQKIYIKSDPHDPFHIMDEDLKDLKYYGVKPGSEIWVGDTEM